MRSYNAANYLSDSDVQEQYIAAIYWATVTSLTVGYGDITPTNTYELAWCMMIMAIGVIIFSYVLGDLASQIGELSRRNKAVEDRAKQIEDLDKEYGIGNELTEKLLVYFEQN